MKRIIFALPLALAVMASPLQAQGHPQAREGFFAGFGLGWGSLGCSDCSGERESGLSGFLKLGGTVNEQLLLGFESNGWVKEENGVRLTQANAAALVQYYPQVQSGFFVKGSLGLATLALDIDGFGNTSETGFGGTLGGGYDFRVARNFSLTPYTNFVYGSFDGGGTNVIQAGLGLNWH